MRRYYTPANAPRPDGTIDLHVRAVDGGQAQNYSRQIIGRARDQAAELMPS